MVLPTTTYPGDKEITDFQRLALERLEALPGVVSASMSYSMPFFGLAEPRKYLVAGRETPEPGHEPVAVINGVSPRYFETAGTRVLGGRTFNEADTAGSPRVYIINQAMARGLFGGESPVGRRIARAGERTIEWGEIVGVAGDIQSVYPDRVTVAYQLFQPMAQEPRESGEIAVRSSGVSASTVVDSIRDGGADAVDDRGGRNNGCTPGDLAGFSGFLGHGLVELVGHGDPIGVDRLDVADDADDLSPFDALATGPGDAPADRTLATEETPRHRLVDDVHPWRVGGV